MSCPPIFPCPYRNGIRVVASANSTLRKVACPRLFFQLRPHVPYGLSQSATLATLRHQPDGLGAGLSPQGKVVCRSPTERAGNAIQLRAYISDSANQRSHLPPRVNRIGVRPTRQR